MERVLIVDDNPSKLADLGNAARELFPGAEIKTYERVDDFKVAVFVDYREAISQNPNQCLLIIDMQMPLYWNERIDLYAGLNVLTDLQVNEVSCPAVIASSEQINEAYAEGAYDFYGGFVKYDPRCSMTEALKTVLEQNNY